MSDTLIGLVAGVLLSLACGFFALVWTTFHGKPIRKRIDPVDAENVITIERWKERRAKVDETFGRRA